MVETKSTIESHFTGLSFEEEKHKYYLNGSKIPVSVSGKLHDFVPPFPKDACAKKAIKLGITEEELQAQWDEKNLEAKVRGSRVHAFGELYPFNQNTMKPSCPQEQAVVQFWADLPAWIVPVQMELRMYHKLHFFAGTMDILLYNIKNDTFIIADYKTNWDLFKNFAGQTLLAPFTHLLDSPFNHYQIQLSYYQLLFEQTGFKVSERKIIWLLMDGTYKMYDTEDLTETLKQHLN